MGTKEARERLGYTSQTTILIDTEPISHKTQNGNKQTFLSFFFPLSFFLSFFLLLGVAPRFAFAFGVAL